MTKSNYGEFFYRDDDFMRYKFRVRFLGLRSRLEIKKATQ